VAFLTYEKKVPLEVDFSGGSSERLEDQSKSSKVVTVDIVWVFREE
jgi:hypothetical protein